jgi:hypothetical protein
MDIKLKSQKFIIFIEIKCPPIQTAIEFKLTVKKNEILQLRKIIALRL